MPDVDELKHPADYIGLALARRLAFAIPMARSMITGERPLGEQWLSIASTLFSQEEIDLGQAAIVLFLDQTKHDPTACFRAALALNKARLFEAAWLLLQATAPTSVPLEEYALLRGSVASNLGDMTVAVNELSRAARARPTSGKAWLRLALILDRGSNDIQEDLIGAEAIMMGAPRRERIRYQYALAKVLDDRGEHSRAFSALCQIRGLNDANSAYDAEADARAANAALEGASREAIEQIGATAEPISQSPIIVTGLPRSGTTLVEQIIAGHSHVAGGDELGYFQLLAAKIKGPSVGHLGHYLRNGGSAASLVKQYTDFVNQRFNASQRVVDKTLEASRHLGIIATLIPSAPIIWLRRHPLDNAWSTFRTYLGSRVNWSYDLAALASHYRLEDQLFARWKAILGDRILTVQYENLVSDPENVIPLILKHCGLPVEEGVFRPECNARPVTTMSLAQVRRPIGRSSIDCARPYAEMLEPFRRAYEGYRERTDDPT